MHEGTVGASVSGRTAGREGGDRAAAGFGRRRAVLAVIRVELMQLRIIAPYLLIMPAGMTIPDLVMGESKNTGVSILFALWWPLLVGATFSMAASLSGSRLYVSLPVRRADVINAYWLMIGGLLIVYLAPFAAIFRSWPRSANMATAFLLAPPTVTILVTLRASIIMSWVRRRATAGAVANGATALAMLVMLVAMVGFPFAAGFLADTVARRVGLIILLVAGAFTGWVSNQRTYAGLEL